MASAKRPDWRPSFERPSRSGRSACGAEAEERYQEAWAISQRLILPISMIEAGLGFARVLHSLGRIG